MKIFAILGAVVMFAGMLFSSDVAVLIGYLVFNFALEPVGTSIIVVPYFIGILLVPAILTWPFGLFDAFKEIWGVPGAIFAALVGLFFFFIAGRVARIMFKGS